MEDAYGYSKSERRTGGQRPPMRSARTHVALTVKIQSNLVHMLRLLRGGHLGAEALSETSLWLITTGGQELTAASSTLIRNLVVKSLSKSLLKFLPILGGVVGYGLNRISTQALGRLTLKWMESQGADG